uniref:Uncharacterized protein n=1 Tax=Oryza rufipogon TaxID=4529 RepID=A0A0E0RF43_ORYRU
MAEQEQHGVEAVQQQQQESAEESPGLQRDEYETEDEHGGPLLADDTRLPLLADYALLQGAVIDSAAAPATDGLLTTRMGMEDRCSPTTRGCRCSSRCCRAPSWTLRQHQCPRSGAPGADSPASPLTRPPPRHRPWKCGR